MKLTNEIRVGIVVFIGMCLLASMVFVIGDIQILNRRYFINVKFSHVDGLLEGAKVTFAGVKVGKVERIDIRGGAVYVRASVAEKIKVPTCCKFTIDTAGLMGEKYLGIDMEPCAVVENYYSEKDVITGTDPLRMAQLFSDGEQIMKKLKKSIDSVNKIIDDDKFIESSKNTVNNIYEVTFSARNFMASLEDRIDGIQDNIEDLIRNFSDVGAALSSVVEDNRTNLGQLVANFKDVGEETLGIIRDNKKSISDLLANFNRTSENLNKMIVKIEDDGRTAEKIREMLENFRKTSKNAEEVTNSINNIFKDGSVETELKSSIKSMSKVARKADSILSSFKNTTMKLLYTLRWDRNDRKTHNDMGINISASGDKSFLLGVRDIGNQNYFDLQFRQNGTGKLTKRMGIIKSKVGVGVDYKWKNNVLYSVDVIDTQKTQVETTSLYKIKENIALQSKVENALKKKERNYNVGIQYQF